jgi:NO-binding membrane sensor protein with MHYT domain
MAPANLDTVSNDVLLVVVDWLEAIVAAGVAACYRKHRRIESTSSILRRTAHLRSSMMSLSSVNKHFRGLLAFQVLKQMTVTVPYSRWEMHGVIQILTSSLALQDNLQ